MTTIAKDFAAKFAIATAAVALALSAFAAPAQAQTTEELQQMINDLLAQVSGLQSQLGQGSTGSVATGVCPYTWTRDLSSGSTGGDVKMLQMFLNADADTRVAAEGVGSAGMETEYYGPATAAAVSKFQVKYRADVLSPAGLVNPTGYFGPSTRGKANTLCVAAPVVDEDEDEDMDEDEEEEEDEDDGELSGEADLDNFELGDGESSLEEGEEDVVIGEITVEFSDGDAEISRLDLALVADGANAEDEPWEVFETISLWVDGDKIAEEEIDDEDNYLDEDAGTIRFSGLDLVAREDDEVEILVAVTAQDNLDGMPETWQLFASAIRFFDADGVATTEDSQDDLAGDEPAFDDDGNVEFDIEAEGTGEDLDVSLSSNNPDGTDVVVDTDNDTDGVTILVADIEAEDNDVELNKVIVRVDVTGDIVTDVVDSIYVVIDGEEFEAESILAGSYGVPSGSRSQHVDANATSTYFLFDIDGDIVVAEDEEVEMEVVVDFNDTDDGSRYANGTVIEASITSTELAGWDAEGADDITPSGSAVGDEMTLVAEGILVPSDGFDSEVDTLGTNDTIGEFVLTFEVTAVEDDFYITENAATTTVSNGVRFLTTGAIGNGSVTGTLTSTGDEDTAGVFTVREGTTETFTLTVSIDPEATGIFRVSLDEIWYTANSNGTAGTIEYNPLPVSDFRTTTQTIQGS